jgi:hypothetical protein
MAPSDEQVDLVGNASRPEKFNPAARLDHRGLAKLGRAGHAVANSARLLREDNIGL